MVKGGGSVLGIHLRKRTIRRDLGCARGCGMRLQAGGGRRVGRLVRASQDLSLPRVLLPDVHRRVCRKLSDLKLKRKG